MYAFVSMCASTYIHRERGRETWCKLLAQQEDTGIDQTSKINIKNDKPCMHLIIRKAFPNALVKRHGKRIVTIMLDDY